MIIFIVLRQTKFRQDSYHRLLLGLSVADLFFTLGWMSGAFTVPAERTDDASAYGTTQSCIVAGFFVQLGTTSSAYNGMLSIYFLLVIVYGVPPLRLKMFECCMHVAVWFYAVTTAVAALPLKAYNSVGVMEVCWLGDFPRNCLDDPNVECLRGKYSKKLIYLYAMVPLIAFLTVVSCNVLIYATVRRIQVTRHSARSIVSGVDAVTEDQKRRTRAVAVQSFLYVFAHFNSIMWCFAVINLEATDMLTQDNQSSFFVLLFLCQVFTPAQGILNLMIYLRPRYLRIRAREPNLSKGSAFFRSMGSPGSKRRLPTLRYPVPGDADEESKENDGEQDDDSTEEHHCSEPPPPPPSTADGSSLSMKVSSAARDRRRSSISQSVASVLLEV